MSTEASHETAIDDACFGEEQADNGELEEDAHQEGEGAERVDVGLEGDEVGDLWAHLIGREEAEGNGEDEEVAQRDADEEERVAAAEKAQSELPFAAIEGGSEEMEEGVDDVR